jgi:hypothetical protein
VWKWSIPSLIALVPAGFLIGHLWPVTPKSTETPSLPHPEPVIAVFAKCDMTSLPIEIPAHSFIRIVPVNKKGMKSFNWGSREISNDTDKAMQWPGRDKLLEASSEHDPGIFVYRCEISNHGEVNLLDVAIPIHFWFQGDAGGDANATRFTPIITPLDVGHSFVLYIVNDCPVQASGVLQDFATVLVVGESKRRTTKLNVPNRDPSDQIMMWFPTKVRWVGSTLCE